MSSDLPPHSSGYEITSTSTGWIIFVSSIIWVPYTILMFYLYFEHKSRKQYPQDMILLFLFLGTLCRAIWLFIYPYYTDYVLVMLLNRFALLFQFTAMCLLMLMWNRALKVTSSLDTKIAILAAREKRSKESVLRDALVVNEITKHRTELIQEQINLDQSLHMKRVLLTIINICAYLFIIITCFIGIQYDIWYTANLVAISVISLLVDVGIIKVGIDNWIRLKKELKPIYQHTNTEEADDVNISSDYFCGLRLLFQYIWNAGSSRRKNDNDIGLKLQAQVIRIVIIVSVTISCFFFVRFFCFLYYPVFVHHYTTSDYGFGNILYPMFFYQLPELLPNLVIALGISPPDGILRRYIWNFTSSAKSQRDGKFDSKDSTIANRIMNTIFPTRSVSLDTPTGTYPVDNNTIGKHSSWSNVQSASSSLSTSNPLQDTDMDDIDTNLNACSNKTRTNTIVSQVSDVENIDPDSHRTRHDMVAEKQAELEYAISQYIYESVTPASYGKEDMKSKESDVGLSMSAPAGSFMDFASD